MTPSFRIVGYEPRHRAAFRDLNLAWIREYFAVEDRDRQELEDPERHILAPGGAIFIAEAPAPGGPAVLGACALIAEPDGAFELAKMAVDPAARGRGVGRALAEAAVAHARRQGAPRVELLSNTALGPAIGLYRALGFQEVPLPRTDYARADIKMVLNLD